MQAREGGFRRHEEEGQDLWAAVTINASNEFMCPPELGRSFFSTSLPPPLDLAEATLLRMARSSRICFLSLSESRRKVAIFHQTLFRGTRCVPSPSFPRQTAPPEPETAVKKP